MKLLFHFFQWCINGIKRGFPKIKVDTSKSLYSAKYVDDLPVTIDKKTIYVLGQPGKEWLCSFACPCGCGDVIELVIGGNTRPHWQIKISELNHVSISPSVSKTTGCTSHFFVTNGRIRWC